MTSEPVVEEAQCGTTFPRDHESVENGCCCTSLEEGVAVGTAVADRTHSIALDCRQVLKALALERERERE